jgi:hypothetical protein
MIHIGAFGGEPGIATAAEIDFLDLDGVTPNVNHGLHVNHNSRVRTGNSSQGVVCINLRKAFTIRGGSHASLNRWFGRFNTVNEVNEGASVAGLSSYPALGVDGLANASAAGQDFIVDTVPTVYAWTDSPVIDLDSLTVAS